MGLLLLLCEYLHGGGGLKPRGLKQLEIQVKLGDWVECGRDGAYECLPAQQKFHRRSRVRLMLTLATFEVGLWTFRDVI